MPLKLNRINNIKANSKGIQQDCYFGDRKIIQIDLAKETENIYRLFMEFTFTKYNFNV